MKSPIEHEKLYGAVPVKCEEIQNLLTDYMNHELGEARSNLIREHLRICKRCRTKASEIQRAISILQKVAQSQADIPEKLSESHRARIAKAALHPLREWFYVHYVIILIFVIIVLIGMAIVFAKLIHQKSRETSVEPAIPIKIGSYINTNDVQPENKPLDEIPDSTASKKTSE